VDSEPHEWLGGTIRNVADLDDRSAYGLPDESGVIVVDVPEKSELGRMGLRKNDVILALGDKSVRNVPGLVAAAKAVAPKPAVNLSIVRAYQTQSLLVDLK
jgi:S1-C subfamily serine protease